MKKVMVIDDEPFILMMIEDKFVKAGLSVISLKKSVGAYEIIKNEMPDLIVLDWMMPELSGIELCKIIKSDPQTQNIPIVMLTAKGQDSDMERGLKSGVDIYIIKPFSPKVLLETVQGLLNKK